MVAGSRVRGVPSSGGGRNAHVHPRAPRRVRGSLERWSLAAIALGAILWLAAPAFMDITYDGNAYVAMGHGWARTGELVMAWGDVLTFHPTPEMPSHHFPPAYPIYLGLVFKAFGYGLAQAKWASVAATFGALAAVWLCTRDLYGPRAGVVVAAVFAVSPWMFWVAGMGFSESLAILFFTLTMWAILRSLDDERFIVIAGAAAGLAYLSRSSMGAFFVIAGLGGLGWRIAHRGWRRTFSSGWYLLAILVFGGIVGLWAYRNIALFEWPNWETSPGTRYIPEWIRDHPKEYIQGLVVRAPLLLLVALPFLALLLPEARRSLQKIRDERISALWLSVFLVFVLGLIFSAAYYSMGPSKFERMRLDNARYVLVGLVPLAWALVREADLDSRRFRKRWGALLAVSLVGCMLVATFPAHYLWGQAAREVDPYVRDGDLIANGGTGKYPNYAYFTDPTSIQVYTQHAVTGDLAPAFIFSYFPQDPAGYTKVIDKTVPHWWWRTDADHVEVWVRDELISERAIPVPLPAPRPGW